MNEEYGEDRKWPPFENFIADMKTKGNNFITMHAFLLSDELCYFAWICMFCLQFKKWMCYSGLFNF